MALSWKSFDFFEVSQVQLPDDETRQYFEGNEVSCVCAGSDSLFLGSFNGWVRIIGPSWKVVRSFQAHDVGTIMHMRQVDKTSLLVTVAEDLSSEPVLKVWALDKVGKNGMPACLSTLVVNNGKKPYPISAFTTLDNLTQIAVGFANGAVTLARGDMVNDMGTKQRIVYESDEPITGLEMSADGQGNTTLIIGTTSRILKLIVPRKGQVSPPKAVEDAGCAVGCMTRDKKTGDIVVGRDDALYYYNMEGNRRAPRAYEAEKNMVKVWGDYIAVDCAPEREGEEEVVRRRFGDRVKEVSRFVLLEAELRLIGNVEILLDRVKALVQMWGDLFLISQDAKIYRYHEKTLPQKLEMLYHRNMYPLAIELAQKSGMDAQQQSVICRKFGDHLYQKGDYDGAMVQYIRAIDSTEPSQVIRKFLDTQRIHNLIQYLEQLHNTRKATSDHTTLLLNCYAKLKDIDKLESFVKSPGDLKFDLVTAISMCRQGGYFEQAAFLAKQHGETDMVVDILIEDSSNYDEALDFIWRQAPEVAYPCMRKYARVLIENCPEDATRLFIDYYTGKYRPRVGLLGKKEEKPEIETSSSPHGGFAGAATAVQNLSNLLPLPYMNTSAIVTPDSPGGTKPTVSDSKLILSPEDVPIPKYTPPPPRTAFSSFIDHPDEFIVFLEACLEEQDLKKADKTDLYTTLFEMYLQKSNEKKGGEKREAWEAKAKKLIDTEDIAMESSSVLLLSHLSSFGEGTLLVKQHSGLYFDIFRSYTSAKDTRGAMKALHKYGPEEPQLYPAALAYLTSDPRILDEAGEDELAKVLAKIDHDHLMAPLQVIQVLVSGGDENQNRRGAANMGMIKKYLLSTIERERKDIAINRRRIRDFRAETEQIRTELTDLSAKPFVPKATRCSACGQGLELPVVHFLCEHSYHQRCLRGGGSLEPGGGGEAELKCQLCRTKNEVIRSYRRQQVESAEKHDVFKAELERGGEAGGDRLGTVARWFGFGVMGGGVGVE